MNNGERVCGEWMIKTHSLFYKMPHEPFVIFDLIQTDKKRKRSCFSKIMERCARYKFITAGLVWEGGAINAREAITRLGSGFHGCQSEPEGVIYRYERNGSFEMSAKYVSNLNVGGEYLNCEDVYNEWKDW